MAANSAVTFTAASYREGVELARKHKGKSFTWDAGEGWVSTGKWCRVAKRVVITGSNPKTGAFC